MFGGMVGAEIKNHEQCYLQYYTFVVQSRGYSINKIDSVMSWCFSSGEIYTLHS